MSSESPSAVEITEIKDDRPAPPLLPPDGAKETLTKFLNSRNLGNCELPVDLASIELPKELSGMNISRISATSQTLRREFRVMRISSESSESSTQSTSEQKMTSSSSFESNIGSSVSSSASSAIMNRLQSIDETKEIQSSPYHTKVITLKNRVQMQHVRSENVLRTKM